MPCCGMFKVCKQRGSALTVVKEAPTFAERSAAEAWVAIFLEQQPDYLQAGLESLSVVPVDHPGIVLGQEGNG